MASAARGAPAARRWRPDIDGLRALAILPVVFYHYDVPGFSGGFVGVDVFFVISGYLIAGVIAAELRAGDFSLLRFYERRARRILPALIVVAAATLAAGLLVLPPGAMNELGNETIWSSFFAANVWFFKKSGYFDGAATLKPLLHLWSLAIEEQFYLFFPLLLALLRRSGVRERGGAAWLAAIFACSLAISVAATHWAPEAGFYLLPSRAWELMCGALLAIAPRPPLPEWARQGAAAGGLAAVVAAVALFTDLTPFPGAAALLPCLGAAGLIVAGEGTPSPVASRPLVWPASIWFGRISYALYLWHWPLLALARFYYLGVPLPEPPLAARLALMGISVALAAATTAWIEAPVRGRRLLAGRGPLLITASASLAAFLTVGEAVIWAGGFPGRMAKAEETPSSAPQQDCGLSADHRASRFDAGWRCRVGSPAAAGERTDFTVWGDSHAARLAPVLDAIAATHGLSGQILWASGCPPLLGADMMTGKGGVAPSQCQAFDRAVADLLRQSPNSTVVLAAFWPNLSAAGASWASKGAQLDDGLGRTLASLRQIGARAILIQDDPTEPVNIVEAQTEARLLGRPLSRPIAVSREAAAARQAWVDARFRRVAADGLADYVRTFDIFCGPDQCPADRNGQLLYVDDNHLSLAGAMLLRPALEAALAGPEAGRAADLPVVQPPP